LREIQTETLPTRLSNRDAIETIRCSPNGPTFANVEDIAGYVRLLTASGCDVSIAEDTGRFAPHFDLYLNMIEMQLTYDVLRTLAFSTDLLETLIDGFGFLADLSRVGKIAQARFVARRD
jgi:hypothetical protein